MKKFSLKRILLTLGAGFVIFYIAIAILLVIRLEPLPVYEQTPTSYKTIVIFGASGTAGDGILKAALANPEIEKIHVVTRRPTHRIEEGVASGKVVMTKHMDYLNYSAIKEQIAEADAIYWAIGISTFKVDEDMYSTIHVDFPARFVQTWMDVSEKESTSFHYISGSDISEDAFANWAREKFRAERTLFALAENSKLKVIAYRPDYIAPTEEEAHIGQDLLYWFFAPVGGAIKAEKIGKSMFEVTARMDRFENGDKVGTLDIGKYADVFDRRIALY